MINFVILIIVTHLIHIDVESGIIKDSVSCSRTLGHGLCPDPPPERQTQISPSVRFKVRITEDRGGEDRAGALN